MNDETALKKNFDIASKTQLDIQNPTVIRTSSRLCLGVEHGDYNGTELFGIGTDRYIWLAFEPNNSKTVRIFSDNFPDEGVIPFSIEENFAPTSMNHSWARFPMGVQFILRKHGYKLNTGFDAVITANIPGGGMSRSASLTLNLLHAFMITNNIEPKDDFQLIDLAVEVENEYIGSPCGQLDQVMILFAKKNNGTLFNQKTRSIDYFPLGKTDINFNFLALDTGTARPGLETSTYKIRRQQCETLVKFAQNAGFEISCLADIKSQKTYDDIYRKFNPQYPHLCSKMKYIFNAQKRFYQMIDAWKTGDIETIGNIFRLDGISLRDDYQISGPQLEEMCNIARTVPGVLGERMLGGGDNGSSGAIAKTDAIPELVKAVNEIYPEKFPDLKDKFAIHQLKTTDGIKISKPKK